MKKELFEIKPKDLTKSVHYTIKGSIVNKVKSDAKKYNKSASEIVNTILNDYYNEIDSD